MAMKTMRDGFFRVEKTNPLIPSAAEFVEITFDKMQGRQLVVNRDVPPGMFVNFAHILKTCDFLIISVA